MKVLFSHVNVGQFRFLHEYFLESSQVESWLVCSESVAGEWVRNSDRIVTIPAERIKRFSRNHPSSPVNSANHISLAITHALRDARLENNLDIYIGHVRFGNSMLMRDRTPFKKISYAEFPSLRRLGYDQRYPPSCRQEVADTNFEMSVYYEMLKSDASVVPSHYAKSLFPNEIKRKISVIHDGVKRYRGGAVSCKDRTVARIGFFASDLSSAKGFDFFVEISNRLSMKYEKLEFVVAGEPYTPYGYEDNFISQTEWKTFAFYHINRAGMNPEKIKFLGHLDRDSFIAEIYNVDIFIYPLRFGCWNWGLVDILNHGGVVVASDNCYVNELIIDGSNGFIVDDEDVDLWISKIELLIGSSELRKDIGARAIDSMDRYSLENSARQYLRLFEKVLG